MNLHPFFENLRQTRERSDWVPLYELTVEEARRADLLEIQKSAGQPQPVYRVDELEIPVGDAELPARLYRPGPGDRLPFMVYFFGGGWTLGNLDTCDGVCRYLAHRGGFATVAVSYRLAPEHTFPTAVNDCYDATLWLAQHGSSLGLSPKHLALGGDSAGGNLAAAVALAARDRGGPPITIQVLIYPVVDYMAETPSMSANSDPLLFNQHSMRWYWDNYLGSDKDSSHPYAAPLRADDLSRLPPALIITAEHDPLRDEGEDYGRRLAAAGVSVESRRYESMAHGFFTALGDLDEARRAADLVANRVRDALRS